MAISPKVFTLSITYSIGSIKLHYVFALSYNALTPLRSVIAYIIYRFGISDATQDKIFPNFVIFPKIS
jgi:hypothetical protein